MKKIKEYGYIIVVILIMIAVAAGILFSVGAFTNKQIWDSTFSFERAIINLPNGKVIDGAVSSWMDFEDGDQIQVKIDGITYLTHISNVCLISE